MLINGFVIKSIEGRILAGVVTFVAVMILVGWVAINEPARMASFSEQHLGRSIERGAELFAANCSTCHGTDSLGIAGRAPALRNPQLFGFNFIKDINGQILGIERLWNDADTQLEAVGTERETLLAELGGSPAPSAERSNEITTRLVEINALIDPAEVAGIQALQTERNDLNTELAAAETTEERKTAINARLEEIVTLLDADSYVALPAKIAVFQALLEPLYAERNRQVLALEAAMLADYLPKYNEMLAAAESGGITEKFAFTAYLDQDANRLNQVGWGGDLASYIRTTLIHGRPGSNNVWPQAMVAWSQTAGGPLRTDQINDIVNYILNYDKGDAWTLEDLYSVLQFAKLHGSSGPAVTVETLGTNVDAAVTAVAALTGDPVRGKALYEGQQRTEALARVGCSSCHVGGVQAPATEETWANVLNIRLNEPQFAGWTPEHYIIASVLLPDDYVVAPYASGVMPDNFGEQLTAQDMADIIAYLKSYSEGS